MLVLIFKLLINIYLYIYGIYYIYFFIKNLAAEMLNCATSTSVSDGIDWGGKCVNYTRMDEKREASNSRRGWGGGAIGCRCNRYSCPIRAFMAGLLFESVVHADLWVEGDFRSEHPLLKKKYKLNKSYLFPVSLSDWIDAGVFVGECDKQSFTVCVFV